MCEVVVVVSWYQAWGMARLWLRLGQQRKASVMDEGTLVCVRCLHFRAPTE